jgi:transposase-like protein
MALADRYTLQNLKADFPTDEACLEALFDAQHTRDCSCGGRYAKVYGRKKYQCSLCRYQIAPTASTIFHKSDTPLTTWFHAVFVFSNAKSGISAKELERQIGVTYKTAWRMLKLIREQLAQPDRKLSGTVEMDETYEGGKHKGGRNNEQLGEAMKLKKVIVGAVERDGLIKAEVSPNAKAAAMGDFLRRNVEVEGTRLMTDDSNRYDRVARGYDRATVNHSRHEYVRGDVYTNTIESFWSHVKRSIRGTHKSVSRRHLQSYVDGFVFHRNNRHSDTARFAVLLAALLKPAGA